MNCESLKTIVRENYTKSQLLDLKEVFWSKQIGAVKFPSNNLLSLILFYWFKRIFTISNDNRALCFEWLELHFWTDWKTIVVDEGHEWIVKFIQKYGYSASVFRIYLPAEEHQRNLDLYIQLIETVPIPDSEDSKLVIFSTESPRESVKRIAIALLRQGKNPLRVVNQHHFNIVYKELQPELRTEWYEIIE